MKRTKQDYYDFSVGRQKLLNIVYSLENLYFADRKRYLNYTELILSKAYFESRVLTDMEKAFQKDLHFKYLNSYFKYLEAKERLKNYEIKFRDYGIL